MFLFQAIDIKRKSMTNPLDIDQEFFVQCEFFPHNHRLMHLLVNIYLQFVEVIFFFVLLIQHLVLRNDEYLF